MGSRAVDLEVGTGGLRVYCVVQEVTIYTGEPPGMQVEKYVAAVNNAPDHNGRWQIKEIIH